MFHDVLLIRSSSGYEPTPNGQRFLDELETSLPRLDRLPSGSDFDPATEETSFRIAATDHACHVVFVRCYAGLCLHPESGSSSISSRCTMGSLKSWKRADWTYLTHLRERPF